MSFFKNVPAIRCPICGASATQKQVNDHLDDGCPRKTPDAEGEGNKSELETRTKDEFSDSDSEYANLELDVDDKISLSFRASRSISNQPNRFGGIRSLCSQDNVEFRPSASPSPSKYIRSPKIERKPLTPLTDGKSVKKELDFENAGDRVPFAKGKSNDSSHIPYYLVNFECVLRGVLDETEDARLFLPEELDFVSKFRGLELDGKKLYVRLFQRKFDWIQIANMNYEEIHDLEKAIESLLQVGLVVDKSRLDDLEKILQLVSAPDLKKLCKNTNLKPKGSKKSDYVVELVSHSKRRNLFSSSSNDANPLKEKLVHKSLQLLGDCYKLSDEPRVVFLRILSLYSLSDWWEERESQKPSGLTTILLKNTGRLIFPDYAIVRNRHIFRDRNDLLRFEEACALESKLSEAFENKDYAEAFRVYREAAMTKLFADELDRDERQTILDLDDHASNLPLFLRKFTAGSVLSYVLTKAVEACEKLRNYDDAVKLLEKLLGQELYLNDYRGLWYERLALDLDQHLKQPGLSLQAVERGLNDPRVGAARKFALCQRAAKIFASKKNAELKASFEDEFVADPNWISPKDPHEEIIQGKLMPKQNVPGAKSVFVMDNGSDSYLCSVEEYVREVYRNDFADGLHAEGSVVNTICAVLFWDVLFELQVPDAFRNPHQAAPLDFDTPDFYLSRRDSIDERLGRISTWTEEEKRSLVTDRWKLSSHVTSSPAKWDLFNNLDHLLGLIACFTNSQLYGLCERLIKNHRHTRSGFPDLTLWNVKENKVWFVEVKGPGDRLSNKQVLWLEFLTQLGLEASVCHVEATNNVGMSSKRGVSRPSSTPPKDSSARKRKRTKRNSGDDFT